MSTTESLTRDDIVDEFGSLLRRRGIEPVFEDQTALRDLGFRSMDFSELAIRIEARLGRDLTFDAAMLRRIDVVADVVEFFETAQRP